MTISYSSHTQSPTNPPTRTQARGRPRHTGQPVVAVALLAAAAGLSMATSRPRARYAVPHHVFIDYCAAGAVRGVRSGSEVLVTNGTNVVVEARFLGQRGGAREIRPGTSAALQLPAGKYAFELNRDGKVLDRKWVELKAGRRYYYFHRQ